MVGLITSFVTTLFLSSAGAAVAALPLSVSVRDLLSSPVTYLGHEIVVSGKVADVYNAHVFTVEEPGLFHTGRDVIVVMEDPDAIAVDGSSVTVIGIVQPFVRDEIASKFDLTGVSPDVLDHWETRPVMLARSVRTSHGAELVAPSGDQLTLSVQVGHPTPAADIVHSVTEITASGNPGALIGRRFSMTRATVQHIAGERSFWIGDGGPTRTFVVVDAVSIANAVGRELRPGDVICVDGVIKAVPTSNGRVIVENWGRLDEADASALAHEKVYVYTKSIHLEGGSSR